MHYNADLSDHFPIYNVNKIINISDKKECFIWKRKKGQKIRSGLYQYFCSWNCSESFNDNFHTKLTECYDNRLAIQNQMKQI